jgi:hypothetical protein
MPRIAVFTKNRTNPAYHAARLGADRTSVRLGATTSTMCRTNLTACRSRSR